jgi:hypothetical protein
MNSEDVVQVVKGFTITVNGLLVKGKPPFARWDEMQRVLRVTDKASPLAIGDLFNSAEEAWGEEYAQLCDATEWSEKTVNVYRWVAKSVPLAVRRMDRLGVRHHMVVAHLTAAQQAKWLDAAADDDQPWSVARLKKALENGGDVAPSGWYVLVQCQSEIDQQSFLDKQTLDGRTCKAVTKRKTIKERAA